MALAISPTINSTLIAVADEKGFFKDEGLDVSLTLNASGRESLLSVSRGEIQVATAACVAFASEVLEDPSLRVLASIGATVGSRVVARRDRNIRVPSDLRGKRVGYSSNTVSEYFLHSFLVTESARFEDVTAVDLPPKRQVEALVRGEVDAVSAFELESYKLERALGANAVSWDSQSNVAYQWLLVTKEDALRSPEPLKRLLKALIRAEYYTRSHEEEAKTILVRKWNLDPEYLRTSWSNTRLDVTLGQSVVTNLQVYTRWRMHERVRLGPPPNVLNYLHVGLLDEVEPGAVTIFR